MEYSICKLEKLWQTFVFLKTDFAYRLYTELFAVLLPDKGIILHLYYSHPFEPCIKISK